MSGPKPLFKRRNEEEDFTESTQVSSASSDVEILDKAHQIVLQRLPKRVRKAMVGTSSRDSFQSCDLYSAEPLQSEEYVASPVIKTPPCIGMRTRRKKSARDQADALLRTTDQAVKNRPLRSTSQRPSTRSASRSRNLSGRRGKTA